MSEPTPAEAAERASAFLRKRAADLEAAGVPPIGPGVIASWSRTDDDADGDHEITAADLQALVDHAYAAGEPCDGERCEDGGAAHCHRCAEVDADNLLKERDRLRAKLDAVRVEADSWNSAYQHLKFAIHEACGDTWPWPKPGARDAIARDEASQAHISRSIEQ